jgi:long-chain fatty acid transport protein
MADAVLNCNWPCYVPDRYLTDRPGSSFGLSEQSVSSLGSAYAGGAAQAEDASTIFFNPAGLALLDRGELQIGGQFLSPNANFQNQGSRLVAPGTPFNNEPLTGGNGRIGEWIM